MKTARKLLVLALVFLTIAVSAQAGQQHIVSPNQLTATMMQKVTAENAGRASVHEALGRSDVRNVAATMGIDLDRLDAVVDTMQDADLEQAASTARLVNQALVGGASSVTLSTTTIIIILLAIILIIVIAKD
jgi:hypothetical protein